ncbi:MAG: LTA synthase family protein [Nitrospinaceae bacterium]
MANLIKRIPPNLSHPIAMAIAVAIVARFAGMVFHYFGTDPNGYKLVASPLSVLFVGGLYHLLVLSLTGAGFLILWKLLRPVRPLITVSAVVFFAVIILLGQIDFGLVRYLGQRFTPAIMVTYLTPSLISSSFYEPLFNDMDYVIPALGIVFAAWWVLGIGCLLYFKRTPKYKPSIPLILFLLLAAGVGSLSRFISHPLTPIMLKPAEWLFLDSFLKIDRTPAPVNAQAAIENLREGIDLAAGEEWMSPEYPIIRAGHPREVNCNDEQGELPDILLFVVESLRGSDVGYGLFGPKPSYTPRLDQLARKSVVFPRYISNGGPSVRAFYSINTSLLPHRNKYVVSNFLDLQVDALPKRLKDLGYHTMILWGGNPSYDNQLEWARKWYDHLDFELPENKLLITRRIGDGLIMDHLLSLIRNHDGSRPDQPIFAYVANAGTHYPFTLEDSYFVPLTAMGDSYRVDTGGIDDIPTRYNLTLKNLDHHIGRVLDVLEKRRKKDNTIIIVIGDHAYNTRDWVAEHLRGMPVDSGVWTSAIIYGPECLVGLAPRKELIPASHVDLMPTLLAMAGDGRAFASMGNDLFEDIPRHHRTAVAIHDAGFRVDQGDFSLYVQAGNPEAFWVTRSFLPKPKFLTSLQGTPFPPDAVKQWSQRIDYWSYLIEQNRVWDENYLIKPGTPKKSLNKRPAGKIPVNF